MLPFLKLCITVFFVQIHQCAAVFMFDFGSGCSLRFGDFRFVPISTQICSDFRFVEISRLIPTLRHSAMGRVQRVN